MKLERARRLEELFADYAQAVRAYAVRRIDPSTADDIVSGVFVEAFRRLDEILDQCSAVSSLARDSPAPCRPTTAGASPPLTSWDSVALLTSSVSFCGSVIGAESSEEQDDFAVAGGRTC